MEGVGNGPISAFCDALATIGIGARVLDYAEHALTEGTDAQAAAYVECEIGGQVFWGVGVDTNTVTASMRAVLSAVNRSRRSLTFPRLTFPRPDFIGAQPGASDPGAPRTRCASHPARRRPMPTRHPASAPSHPSGQALTPMPLRRTPQD